MEVKTLIRYSRKQQGLTLKKLSQKSGVSLSFISDIENGRRLPSIEKAKMIADALDIDFKLLLDSNKVAVLREASIYNADPIINFNIKAIVRASEYLADEECLELRTIAERLFPQAFKNLSDS